MPCLQSFVPLASFKVHSDIGKGERAKRSKKKKGVITMVLGRENSANDMIRSTGLQDNDSSSMPKRKPSWARLATNRHQEEARASHLTPHVSD